MGQHCTGNFPAKSWPSQIKTKDDRMLWANIAQVIFLRDVASRHI